MLFVAYSGGVKQLPVFPEYKFIIGFTHGKLCTAQHISTLSGFARLLMCGRDNDVLDVSGTYSVGAYSC